MTDRQRYYLLKGREAVQVERDDWSSWFESAEQAERQLARTFVNGVLISTIFLGLDYSFRGGKPLIFETMTFTKGSNYSERDCERYTTWKEATKGHKKFVRRERAEAYQRNPKAFRGEALDALRRGQFVQFAQKYKDHGEERWQRYERPLDPLIETFKNMNVSLVSARGSFSRFIESMEKSREQEENNGQGYAGSTQ